MDDDGSVYLEHQIIGQQSKMTAVDPKTGIEVVVFGPVKALKSDLQKLAVRKLKKRLSDISNNKCVVDDGSDLEDDRPGRLA
jgi:hypothetical protein